MRNFFKSAKAKILALVGIGVTAATNASAAVTFDPSSMSFSGNIDVAPYMSGAAIILTALAAFWAVRKVIGLFGR